MHKTMTTKKPSALVTSAFALFSVSDADKIPAILFALGLRENCGRCGGSGAYSWCSAHGSTCFGCSGRGVRAAKLTKATLAAATVKVEAGELVALRTAYAAKLAAKRAIGPLVKAAAEIYATIGNAYTSGGKSAHSIEDFVVSPLFRAQTMNNALMYGDTGIYVVESAVKQGARRDYDVAFAEVEALTALLLTLRAEWLAFAPLKEV